LLPWLLHYGCRGDLDASAVVEVISKPTCWSMITL
jgi:hypothetical protein